MEFLKIIFLLISFLKPGIIKIYLKIWRRKFFVEDGIVEFKNNNLAILTSSIFNLNDIKKDKLQKLMEDAERESNKVDLNDQSKYLIDQKIRCFEIT